MNELRKIVFSMTLQKVGWQNARLATAAAEAEVARLKQETGRDIAIPGGAKLAASLVQFSLIDECRFFINPVVLGGGTPMLRGVERRRNLQLVNAEAPTSGVVALYYQPR